MIRARCHGLQLVVGLTCALAVSPALAHPHVFAEARLDISADADGRVTALRHVWRFDDVFSSTVLLEFDADKDLQLDAQELENVSNVVHQSLAEFNYFQLVTRDGTDVPMEAPKKLIADFVDSQLIILFESKPREALPLSGKVVFGVYDPTFYTAIDFAEDSYLSVDPLPDRCEGKVVRPDADQALAENQQTLTEAFFDDPTSNDMSKIFATRLTISCAGQG